MTEDDLFLTAILNCTRSELYTRPTALTEVQREQLESMRWRRAAGEPVQYICGFTEFMGYRMEVGPGVLIPRPETEVLAHSVIEELKAREPSVSRVLDIGTGSGCIPVALARRLPGCLLVGLESSSAALDYARRNVELNGVSDRIELIQRDVFWYVDETALRFDAIVSNPPYVPTFMMARLPEDVRRKPEMALDGGPDGLHFYRFIVPASRRILNPGGLLALEFGDGQRKELENLLVITGEWDKIRVVRDNAGRDRIILATKI